MLEIEKFRVSPKEVEIIEDLQKNLKILDMKNNDQIRGYKCKQLKLLKSIAGNNKDKINEINNLVREIINSNKLCIFGTAETIDKVRLEDTLKDNKIKERPNYEKEAEEKLKNFIENIRDIDTESTYGLLKILLNSFEKDLLSKEEIKSKEEEEKLNSALKYIRELLFSLRSDKSLIKTILSLVNISIETLLGSMYDIEKDKLREYVDYFSDKVIDDNVEKEPFKVRNELNCDMLSNLGAQLIYSLIESKTILESSLVNSQEFENVELDPIEKIMVKKEMVNILMVEGD